MPHRRPTELRRPQLADAALHIVATRGIAALSTRTLAEAVGLSSGALFKHYPSRDALLLGMAERVQELLEATYPDAALPPRVRLERLARARLSLVADSAGVLTLVLSEQFALALPQDALRVLREAVGQTHRFVACALQQGQREGSIRADVCPRALALLYLGALQMTALVHRTSAAGGAPQVLETLDCLLQPVYTPESA